MKTSSLFILFTFSSLAACSGETLDVGTKSTQQAGTGVATPTSRSPALDDICESAHGPSDPLTKLGEINPHLAGPWYRCDTTEGTPWTKSGQGFEIVPTAGNNSAGAFYALDFDAAGEATREQGLDGQGTYTIAIATDTSETFPYADTVPFGQMFVTGSADNGATVYPDPNNPGHYFEFETNPRRMRMDGKIWFVSTTALQQ